MKLNITILCLISVLFDFYYFLIYFLKYSKIIFLTQQMQLLPRASA